jgi:hypothetical protein
MFSGFPSPPGPVYYASPYQPALKLPFSPSQYQPVLPYSLDHTTLLQTAHSANTNCEQPNWIMDSGASSHVTGKAGNLTATHSNLGLNSQHIIVGIGSKLHILAVGSVKISSLPLHLQNVLVSPSIVKNLIFVR